MSISFTYCGVACRVLSIDSKVKRWFKPTAFLCDVPGSNRLTLDSQASGAPYCPTSP